MSEAEFLAEQHRKMALCVHARSFFFKKFDFFTSICFLNFLHSTSKLWLRFILLSSCDIWKLHFNLTTTSRVQSRSTSFQHFLSVHQQPKKFHFHFFTFLWRNFYQKKSKIKEKNSMPPIDPDWVQSHRCWRKRLKFQMPLTLRLSFAKAKRESTLVEGEMMLDKLRPQEGFQFNPVKERENFRF